MNRPYGGPRPDSGVESGKFEAVETMIERGETAALGETPVSQRELLQANLSRVDRGLLLWANQQGVRLQVLEEGEELEATQALRDLSGQFEEQIDADKIAKIHQHLEPLTEKIRSEKDADKALSLRRQKRAELAEILTHNPCGGAVFTPAFAPLLAPGLSKLAADPTETPTLKGMALHHGADSAEEQAKFYRWMEMLNGDRLQKARQASIDERSRLLAGKPEAQQRWLEQARTQPETVPLDVTLYTLVVPDAHFFPSVSSPQPLLIDRSDLRSIEGWSNGDFRGQWFFLGGKSNLLIRESALNLDTPVHELGHVIDMTLEKVEPEFYQTLRPRIEKAHYKARLEGRAISNYAMANRREYIAEGFAAFYTRPQELRHTDPELHSLVEAMVEFCCQKTGADRRLDQSLQKMWRDATATDPGKLDAGALKEQFEKELATTPKAAPLSQSAMVSALRASQSGLLVGIAEAALSVGSATPPEEKMVDSIQRAYREGLDIEEQRKLFELGYQYSRALAS